MQASRFHAVVLPGPFQGHINPLMHLSMHLAQSAGFTITFVNNEFNHTRMLQSLSHDGMSSFPDYHSAQLDFRFMAISDGLPSDHKRDVGIEFFEAITHQMTHSFDNLIAELVHGQVSPPISCIIYDIFMRFVPRVCKKYTLPSVAFFPQSAASFACHHIISNAFSAGMNSAEDLTNLINTIPGVPRLQWTDIITFLQCADPSDFFFNFMTQPFKNISEPTVILVNTSEEIEDCRFLREHEISNVGPMLPSSYLKSSVDVNGSRYRNLPLWPEDYECLQWLDTQAPSSVVYVSYGSLAVMSAKQLEEFALGLEATEMPVLWVLRPDLVYGERPTFLQTWFDRMKARVQLVSWAPQLQVLSHVSVGAFLTHCGWNSTLESILQGIPMICWPWFADQKLDRRLIVDKWKIGVEFEVDEEGLVTRREVEEKVRCVMGGKEFHERAAELRDAIRKAGGCSKNMESFIHSLKQCIFNTKKLETLGR